MGGGIKFNYLVYRKLKMNLKIKLYAPGSDVASVLFGSESGVLICLLQSFVGVL